jgi:hypothetical protein
VIKRKKLLLATQHQRQQQCHWFTAPLIVASLLLDFWNKTICTTVIYTKEAQKKCCCFRNSRKWSWTVSLLVHHDEK